MKKVPFELHERIYNPTEINEVLKAPVNEKNIISNRTGERFYKIPCDFDIEKTRFYRDKDERAYK